MHRVHFVSLGCPKNRVDSEQMAALARQAGLEPEVAPERADAIVVHTCGFIEEAKAESIEVLLEMGALKRPGAGRCRALIATGCLVQRHADELAQELPEVDAFLGTAAWGQIVEVLQERLEAHADAPARIDTPAPAEVPPPTCGTGRELGDHRGTTYLKIAEGCDRRCAFCIIPELRGPQRSRPLPELVDEAQTLAAAGVRELVLVAQDLTAYGRDRLSPLHPAPGRPAAQGTGPQATRRSLPDLVDLLQALDAVDGLSWIRCLYAYPQGVNRRLSRALATSQRVLPYLDLPVQHVSSAVLKRMRRGRGGAAITDRLARLRRDVPDLVLRTTLLVGFPGETAEDFAELERFVDEEAFDRLGVFAYSDEEGTRAAGLRDKVPRAVARQRERTIMRRQRRISRRWLRRLRGTVHEAIVEGLHPESDLLVVGRLWSQAPEIDGFTFLSSPRPLSRGEVVKARITDSHDHDLVAEVLDPEDPTPAAPFEVRSTARR